MIVLLAALAAVALLALVLAARKSGNPDMTVHIGGRGIFGRILSSLAGVAAPVKTANPSITGPNSPPLVGDTLTATHGTYTGTVTGYAGQWYSGASPIALATALTYVVQITDENNNITYQESAYNRSPARSSATGTSNAMGPVSGSTLATPTLAIQSALGTAPLVLQWSDTDDVIGLYAQLEIDQTSSAFSNITQNLVFFVDGGSYALNSENIGLITPSGTYWARLRTCRDNDSGAATVTGTDPQGNAISFSADVSGFSNVVTDTISVSSATFATSGISPYLTLSNSNKTVAQNNASVGAPCLDRASIHNQNAKFTVEFTVADLYNGTGTRGIYFGVCDSTPSFSSPGLNNNPPGSSTGPVPGISCTLKMGDTSLTVLANGLSNTPALGATAAATDVFHIEVDTTTDKFDIWYIPLGTGTAVHLTGSPFTLTGSYIPATWFAFGGGQKGNGTIGGNASDAVTANFGASPWAKTPTSGFGIYG